LGVQKMQETDRNSTYQTKQLAHTHTNTWTLPDFWKEHLMSTTQVLKYSLCSRLIKSNLIIYTK
jgi:hypothetical protein